MFCQRIRGKEIIMKKKPVTIQSLKRRISELEKMKEVLSVQNEVYFYDVKKAELGKEKAEADLTVSRARESRLRDNLTVAQQKFNEMKEIVFCEYISQHSDIDYDAFQQASTEAKFVGGFVEPEQFRQCDQGRQGKFFNYLVNKMNSINFY